MSETQDKAMLKRFLTIIEILLKATQSQGQVTVQANTTEEGEQDHE